MRRHLILFILFLLFCLHGLARGQTEGYNCYYWFDSQNGKVQTSPMQQGLFDVDVSALDDGIHSFHCLMIDNNGIVSPPAVRFFMKTPKADNVIQGYYWFDEETEVRSTTASDGTFEVDASSLSDGFHRFHYQALQVNGGMSITSTSYFLKTAQVNPDDELTCICTVDDQLRHIEKLSAQGGVIHWNLAMQDLADGVHKIQLQAMTPSGALSSSYTSYFMRVTSYEDLSEMYCVYAIDDNSFNSKSNVVSQNGSFHFDLDLSELEEGLHYITFLLNNDRGTSTTAQTRFFVKVPLGGNGINQYQYWLNDDEINAAITATLPEKVNPLQLISLLPVESRPLRSLQFHFDISTGKPMIYAKNTIHLRFHDIAMRFSDVAKDYADYSQSREVEPVGDLLATQTFPTIEENDIRWYTVQAAPGDTVAFKLSQPATIQLFAPSGEEVFKTSESASVKWDGIHVWEDGTYYLAVHDVTGSKADMTLEYIHMDKYDVVDWDVHIVGNGGCSTITFKGNGFRDLYAVDLVIVPGDTIHSVFVSHNSDAETAVAFDFTDAILGEYNAVFHFTEENKHVSDVVVVEEAKEIELALDVKYPSSFLRGTSTTFTISVTNKGNATAYGIPMEIYLDSGDSFENIQSVIIKDESGNILNNLSLDETDKDSIDNKTLAYTEGLLKQLNGKQSFVVWKDSIGGEEYGFSDMFLTIPANSTTSLYMEIKSLATVNLNVRIPSIWLTVYLKEQSSEMREKTKSFFDRDWCCEKEKWQCWGEVIANIGGLLPGVGCVTGAVDYLLMYNAYNIACTEGENIIDKMVKFFFSIGVDKERNRSHILRGFNSLTGCLVGTLKKPSNITKILDTIRNGVNINIPKCRQIGKKVSDECSPTLTYSGGGSSSPRPPADPNDIFGPLSEAGSNFIADSVARVNSTIEFENDTAFAEASAHTIVIKDTLDSRYFDLKSFMPTGIKLGEHETFLNERQDVKSGNGVTSFVKTIDLRPAINVIAQVDGIYDQTKGIAQWTFQSLDPMTMEPTDDLMQGILPVNYDGTSGIGEVMFEIGVKSGKADGTEVNNRASIVFDYEDAILTPTWTNIVDAIAPNSYINEVVHENSSKLGFRFHGEDNASGIWKYRFFVQAGQNAPWWEEATDITPDSTFYYPVYEDIDYGFCVLAVDSAGNVEKKTLYREYSMFGWDDAVKNPTADASIDGTTDIYDLSGRRRTKPEENGINIIGQKKYLIRRKGK